MNNENVTMVEEGSLTEQEMLREKEQEFIKVRDELMVRQNISRRQATRALMAHHKREVNRFFRNAKKKANQPKLYIDPASVTDEPAE